MGRPIKSDQDLIRIVGFSQASDLDGRLAEAMAKAIEQPDTSPEEKWLMFSRMIALGAYALAVQAGISDPRGVATTSLEQGFRDAAAELAKR